VQAVILAAGEGRRLGPLTEKRPKPMLSLAGKPVLEHNLRLLRAHGIVRIFMNIHHCANAIVEHFGDGSALGIHVEYSREETLLGTAGALRPLREWLTSTFLVLYGDNLTTCDLTALIAFHRLKGGVVTMAVYHRENATAGGIMQFDADDRIVRFVEKPKSGEVFSSWVNAGIMVCEPQVLDAIPPGFSDFGKNIIPDLLAAGKALFAYRMDDRRERLFWIDSPEDYERAKSEVQAWILE
jgi:NDP-sugar pyrophosphorylase family protein